MRPPRITLVLIAIGLVCTFALTQWALAVRDDGSLARYLATPTAAER
jgi:hypothetical protein